MSEAFKPLLGRLADGAIMDRDEAIAFFAACFRGEPSPTQIAAALTAIRMRGETVAEIAAGAQAMRDASIKLQVPYPTLDVCGTGGDGSHTLNISTAVAFVAAGGGLKVAKHGNRALSSKSGTADVLAALGVDVNAPAARQRQALDEAGLCFMFAQTHHGAMRHVSPIRAELGFRTLVNLLGPFTNPAGAKRQVVGVFSERWVEPLARVLGDLGAERAWVVHGSGLDEITTTGETKVAEWHNGTVREFTIQPEDVGLPRRSLDEIIGADPAHNAKALSRLLAGETGAYRDTVLLNAAAAFVVGEKAQDLSDGVALAREVIDDGRARKALERLVAITSAP